MRLPQGRPERRDRPWLRLATLLPTWACTGASTGACCAAGGGVQRAHHRADHVTQRQPRTLSRLGTHSRHRTQCSCCLGRRPARPASRRAIRTHLFAAAARRQTCAAGASTTLGDDCNADATQRRGVPTNADATGRLVTDADATARALRQRKADATGRGGTPNSTERRGYEATRDNAVTPGTLATWKRWTDGPAAITVS